MKCESMAPKSVFSGAVLFCGFRLGILALALSGVTSNVYADIVPDSCDLSVDSGEQIILNEKIVRSEHEKLVVSADQVYDDGSLAVAKDNCNVLKHTAETSPDYVEGTYECKTEDPVVSGNKYIPYCWPVGERCVYYRLPNNRWVAHATWKTHREALTDNEVTKIKIEKITACLRVESNPDVALSLYREKEELEKHLGSNPPAYVSTASRKTVKDAHSEDSVMKTDIAARAN